MSSNPESPSRPVSASGPKSSNPPGNPVRQESTGACVPATVSAGGDISVDAAVLAEALGMSPAEILQQIREWRICAVHERGVGEDAGHDRMTFYHGARRVRLLIDHGGAVVSCAVEQVSAGVPRRRAHKRHPSRLPRLPRDSGDDA